jgi:hypothetical protein
MACAGSDSATSGTVCAHAMAAWPGTPFLRALVSEASPLYCNCAPVSMHARAVVAVLGVLVTAHSKTTITPALCWPCNAVCLLLSLQLRGLARVREALRGRFVVCLVL